MTAASISRQAAAALALATVSAWLVTVPASATSYPPSCTETFPAVTPSSFQAPAQSTAIGLVAVAVSGQVADVDVTVWAAGVEAGDFTFGPEADFSTTHAQLASVGGTVDLDGVTFDDEAAGGLSGSSPYTGHVQPIDPLSGLDGLNASQTWELQVINGGNAPINVSWTLTVTYAGCVPDQDADGVADAKDACPTVAAATVSGCPTAKRNLTATYRRGAFRGALDSPVHGCLAHRPVTVWKVRTGADLKVGRTSTSSQGRYTLDRPKRRGRYYAVSPRAVVSGVAECPRVVSDRFRIG